ncbi:hypothetical protein OH77DRAFT_1017211 [Trametes cingulata]|nr:hypothetical protein OH77DRAFT_1017211 [Trametes cingulata]
MGLAHCAMYATSCLRRLFLDSAASSYFIWFSSVLVLLRGTRTPSRGLTRLSLHLAMRRTGYPHSALVLLLHPSLRQILTISTGRHAHFLICPWGRYPKAVTSEQLLHHCPLVDGILGQCIHLNSITSTSWNYLLMPTYHCRSHHPSYEHRCYCHCPVCSSSWPCGTPPSATPTSQRPSQKYVSPLQAQPTQAGNVYSSMALDARGYSGRHGGRSS